MVYIIREFCICIVLFIHRESIVVYLSVVLCVVLFCVVLFVLFVKGTGKSYVQ